MYNKILEHLNKGENFSISRFGDGEWACILGNNGKNCDGHTYFKDLGRRLSKVLKDNRRYYLGLQNYVYKNENFHDFINEYIMDYSIDFVDGNFLHRASIKDQLGLFFDALKGKDIVLVGPERLKKLKQIEVREYVVVPDVDCWNAYVPTLKQLLPAVKENTVVLYCASMMSNVLIDDLFITKNDTITQIDCGSVFEPYINVRNRSYHKGIIQRIKEKGF